jgi:hypothetical protein
MQPLSLQPKPSLQSVPHFGAARKNNASQKTGADQVELKKGAVQIPEKRQHIKLPKFTVYDLSEKIVEMQTRDYKLGWMSMVRLAPSYVRAAYETVKLFGALPEESKTRIAGYGLSLQIWRDYFNKDEPGLIFRKFASYAGPPVGKLCQNLAQSLTQMDAEKMEAGIKVLEAEVEKQKKSASKDDSSRLPLKEKLLQIKQLKAALWVKKVLTPMLDTVPPVPFKEIQPQLNQLVDALKQEFPECQISAINPKPIGSGTIAQCYEVSLKEPLGANGDKKLVVKVNRPDVNESYIQQFDDLLYRAITLFTGTSSESLETADQRARSVVSVLRDEIIGSQEHDLARQMKDVVQKGNIPIQIPEVYLSSNEGMVMAYAEGKNLNQLPVDRQREVLKTYDAPLAKLAWESVRHLDPHSGNIRWDEAKQQLTLLDFGRGAILDKDGHKNLLTFMTRCLSASGDRLDVLKDSEREKLVPLMQGLFKSPEAKAALLESEELQELLFDAGRNAMNPDNVLLLLAMLNYEAPTHLGSTVLSSGVSKLDITKSHKSLLTLYKINNYHQPISGWEDAELETILQQGDKMDPKVQNIVEHCQQEIFGLFRYSDYNSSEWETPPQDPWQFYTQLDPKLKSYFISMLRKDLRLNALAQQTAQHLESLSDATWDSDEKSAVVEQLRQNLNKAFYERSWDTAYGIKNLHSPKAYHEGLDLGSYTSLDSSEYELRNFLESNSGKRFLQNLKAAS